MDHPENLQVLPPNITLEEFNKEISETGHLCVVDFFATWCPPCQRLVGELPNIAKANPDVSFFKVNVEENQAISSHFNVSSIPHVAFLKDNGSGTPTVLETVIGFNINKINQNLSSLK